LVGVRHQPAKEDKYPWTPNVTKVTVPWVGTSVTAKLFLLCLTTVRNLLDYCTCPNVNGDRSRDKNYTVGIKEN